MRDIVVEKCSPFAFLMIVIWYIDGPRAMLRGVLFEICLNASISFGWLSDFFR